MHGRSRQTWKLTGTNLSTKLEAVSAKWWTLAVSARSMTLGAWPNVDSHALQTTCDNQGRTHTKFAVDSMFDTEYTLYMSYICRHRYYLYVRGSTWYMSKSAQC